MLKSFKLKINSVFYQAFEGESILDFASRNNRYIPTLCHHSDIEASGSCRLCLVEIDQFGEKKIVTACNTKVSPEMKISLDTPEIKKARKVNLEMLISDHIQKCSNCNSRYSCDLKKLAEEFDIKKSRFSERRRKYKIDQKNPSIYWDSSKCIECGNCISACKKFTGLEILKTKYTGSSIIFGPKNGESFADTNCIYCGQCITHCPSGSLQEKPQYFEVEKLLKNKKDNILIAQIAPSTRYSIGELFNFPPGANLEKKLISALKDIGFDYVFDVNFGADITTVEEAAELIEKIESKKGLPMFTSCCPSWVRYVEIFHHDLIPYLAKTKSPSHCLASAVRSYFAKKIQKNQKKLIIVEIMPCVAKKNEAKINELRQTYNPEINFSLTVRELGFLFKKQNIDIGSMPESDFDSPLGESTGAASIYGASGGVMESALRSVARKISGQKLDRIEFDQVRGLSGIKTASIDISGLVLHVAVVSGLRNAAKLIKDIKSGVSRYDYIEVMACPGGCLSGGGQPMPTNDLIRNQRLSAYYKDDKNKLARVADDNKDLKKLYSFLNTKPLEIKSVKLFHRKFIKRKQK